MTNENINEVRRRKIFEIFFNNKETPDYLRISLNYLLYWCPDWLFFERMKNIQSWIVSFYNGTAVQMNEGFWLSPFQWEQSPDINDLPHHEQSVRSKITKIIHGSSYALKYEYPPGSNTEVFFVIHREDH